MMSKKTSPTDDDILETLESHTATMERLCQETRVLRQAIDEFRIDFTHLLRNLPANLPPPYQHLRALADSFACEHVPDDGRANVETLSCYECDAESPPGLAQALHDGWIDLSCGEEEHSANFVGWCPDCQRAHEQCERELNTGWVQPMMVAETESIRDDSFPEQATRSDSRARFERQVDSNVPSRHSQKRTPLLTRLYHQRHLEALVRAIGYETLPLDEWNRRCGPLTDKYGRESVRGATDELLDITEGESTTIVRLRQDVRQLVRGILGPPPVGS